MWKVYDKTGTKVRCEVRKVQYSGTFMGECFVNTTINSELPIDFEIGDYFIYRNEQFTINYDPSVLKKAGARKNGEAYVYDGVKFNSYSDELTRCDFLDYVLADNFVHFSSLPTFSFFASSIQDLADRIQANLDRVYTGDQKWTVEVHPEYVNTTNVNIDASKLKVWAALDFIKSKFDANFIIRGRKIIIGTAGVAIDNVFQYGKGKGLFEIQRVAESNQQIITRLRVYGSTRNLPVRYYNKLSDASLTNYLPNNMAVQNLMLPDFPKRTLDAYIDSPNISVLGVREDSVYFDGSDESLPEIYPSMEGMTAEQLIAAGISCSIDTGDNGNLDEIVTDATEKDGKAISDDGMWDKLKEGENIPSFLLTIKDVGFDINDYLTGETATISMEDGMCGGREFEITKCEKKGNKYILTCNRVYDDGLKLYFPYKDYNIKAGDKFVFLNIDMPEVYISAAAQRLLKAGKEYLAKNDYVRYTYEVKIDEIYMARHPQLYSLLKEGDLMLFTESDFKIDGSIIIDSLRITEGEGLVPTYEVTLANEKSVGTLEKIQNAIDSIGGGQGSGGYNAQQINSLIRTFGSKLFLSKISDDIAQGVIQFLKGAVFGEFAEGISGFGGKIDQFGSAWLDSLSVRKFLEVPELRYNRISIEVGNRWNAPGGGIVESVVPDTDVDGNILNTGTIILHLQDKEIGKVAVDDICQGIFHDGMTLDNNFSDDYDDGIGNFQFSGFYTCYFRITDILEVGRNSKFRYMLRGVSDRWRFLFHPCEAMHFVGYGNFTDKSRQTSRYSTRTYERYLRGVNDWEFTSDNIGAQFGDLSNLSVFGMNMEGYSAYLNNIYMTGVIEQLENYPARIEIDTQGDNFLAFGETMDITCRVFKGWSDITDTVTKWRITRDSGDTADDEAWAIKNKNFAGNITLAYEDLGDNAITSVSTLFTVTATNKTDTAKAIISI